MRSLDRHSYNASQSSNDELHIRTGSNPTYSISLMSYFNLNEEELLSTGIEVKNIVAKLELGIELDLTYLSTKLSNSRYEPEQYPSLVFRPTGLSTVLVTRSGILLFTGVSSVSNLEKTYRRVSSELKGIGINDVKNVEEIEIVNVVSTFELSSSVDLNKISIELGFENIEYEPEQFPGLVYRIENGPVVLIFSSGKIVITGAESTPEILNAVNTVRKFISG